jgi:hypothetical protein
VTLSRRESRGLWGENDAGDWYDLRTAHILRLPVYRFTLLVVSCPSVRTEKSHISEPYARSSLRIRGGKADGVWWTIMPSLSGGRKIREPMIAWPCYYLPLA